GELIRAGEQPMHRLGLRAVRLELLVGALFPIIRNRRQTTPVDSALEAQPSFRCLAGEHGLTTDRKATIALSSAIGERLGLFGRPTVSMPPLVLAWNDVERAPLSTQGIDECPQAHSPSPPSANRSVQEASPARWRLNSLRRLNASQLTPVNQRL